MKLSNIFLVSHISILDRQLNLDEVFLGDGSLLCRCVGLFSVSGKSFSIRHLVNAPFGNTNNLHVLPFSVLIFI